MSSSGEIAITVTLDSQTGDSLSVKIPYYLVSASSVSRKATSPSSVSIAIGGVGITVSTNGNIAIGDRPRVPPLTSSSAANTRSTDGMIDASGYVTENDRWETCSERSLPSISRKVHKRKGRTDCSTPASVDRSDVEEVEDNRAFEDGDDGVRKKIRLQSMQLDDEPRTKTEETVQNAVIPQDSYKRVSSSIAFYDKADTSRGCADVTVENPRAIDAAGSREKYSDVLRMTRNSSQGGEQIQQNRQGGLTHGPAIMGSTIREGCEIVGKEHNVGIALPPSPQSITTHDATGEASLSVVREDLLRSVLEVPNPIEDDVRLLQAFIRKQPFMEDSHYQVVTRGRKIGIFTSSTVARECVDGVPNNFRKGVTGLDKALSCFLLSQREVIPDLKKISKNVQPATSRAQSLITSTGTIPTIHTGSDIGHNNVFRLLDERIRYHRGDHIDRYYVVAVGREPGIYIKKEDFNKRINGISSNCGKVFNTRTSAEMWYFDKLSKGEVETRM